MRKGNLQKSNVPTGYVDLLRTNHDCKDIADIETHRYP
jgi:hypothetical protein